MTTEECKQLKPDTVVALYWPGSNTGGDCKPARVVRVKSDGSKVGVNVAQTTFGGQLTHQWGSSVRWYEADRILGVMEGAR